MKLPVIAFVALAALTVAVPAYACSGISIHLGHAPRVKAKAKPNLPTADKVARKEQPKSEPPKQKPAADTAKAKVVNGGNDQSGQNNVKRNETIPTK